MRVPRLSNNTSWGLSSSLTPTAVHFVRGTLNKVPQSLIWLMEISLSQTSNRDRRTKIRSCVTLEVRTRVIRIYTHIANQYTFYRVQSHWDPSPRSEPSFQVTSTKDRGVLTCCHIISCDKFFPPSLVETRAQSSNLQFVATVLRFSLVLGRSIWSSIIPSSS